MRTSTSRSRRLTRRQLLGMLGLGASVRDPTRLLAAVQGQGRGRSAVAFPRGAVIRTILEDLSPEALAGGSTLFHEHISGNLSSPPVPPGERGRGATPAPSDEARSLDVVVEELKMAWADGVRCIVDATTNRRSAQNIERVRTLAKRSAMHVVVAGGYYRAPYPAPLPDMTDDQIAAQFVEDARVQRWGAIGEIGTSVVTHPDERKMLRAVARTHRETGLPIFTHTPHESCPSCALEQLDLLEGAGVSPKSICIGHISSFKPADDPRMQTAKALAKRGAFLGFDTVGHQGRTSLVTEAEKVKMFLQVLEAGFEDNVLVAADFSIAEQLKANYGAGFSSAVVVFVPKLRYAGVSEATIQKILIDNSRRFLAFVPKQ